MSVGAPDPDPNPNQVGTDGAAGWAGAAHRPSPSQRLHGLVHEAAVALGHGTQRQCVTVHNVERGLHGVVGTALHVDVAPRHGHLAQLRLVPPEAQPCGPLPGAPCRAGVLGEDEHEQADVEARCRAGAIVGGLGGRRGQRWPRREQVTRVDRWRHEPSRHHRAVVRVVPVHRLARLAVKGKLGAPGGLAVGALVAAPLVVHGVEALELWEVLAQELHEGALLEAQAVRLVLARAAHAAIVLDGHVGAHEHRLLVEE